MIPEFHFARTFRRLLTFTLLTCVVAGIPSAAGWEHLPRGDWQEEENGDLRLNIGAKNTLTFGGEHFTNAITVKAVVTAQVRREYWCLIQEIESRDLKKKAEPKKKDAVDDDKAGEKKEAGQPRTPEPLRLDFLQKGERLVLTIGYDEKKKKDVLEILAFRDGKVARELRFLEP